ncbi:MAG: hypothetical protein DRP62_08505 [Planctomycetota bacterium]|nr:MAG: hypothetical protein DRP62_08505 [Planctomycetota bacterium]
MVEPAGGETGVPRCLAEVRKLPTAALFHRFKKQMENLTTSREIVKQNLEKNNFFKGPLTAQFIYA